MAASVASEALIDRFFEQILHPQGSKWALTSASSIENLQIATEHGLFSYVAKKLERESEIRAKRVATSILASMINALRNRLKAHKGSGVVDTVCPDCLTFTKLLIDMGAEPNHLFKGLPGLLGRRTHHDCEKRSQGVPLWLQLLDVVICSMDHTQGCKIGRARKFESICQLKLLLISKELLSNVELDRSLVFQTIVIVENPWKPTCWLLDSRLCVRDAVHLLCPELQSLPQFRDLFPETHFSPTHTQTRIPILCRENPHICALLDSATIARIWEESMSSSRKMERRVPNWHVGSIHGSPKIPYSPNG